MLNVVFIVYVRLCILYVILRGRIAPSTGAPEVCSSLQSMYRNGTECRLTTSDVDLRRRLFKVDYDSRNAGEHITGIMTPKKVLSESRRMPLNCHNSQHVYKALMLEFEDRCSVFACRDVHVNEKGVHCRLYSIHTIKTSTPLAVPSFSP